MLVVLTIRRAASKRENHRTGSFGVNKSTRYPVRMESATIVRSVIKRRWLACLGRYRCSPGILIASVCTSCIMESISMSAIMPSTAFKSTTTWTSSLASLQRLYGNAVAPLPLTLELQVRVNQYALNLSHSVTSTLQCEFHKCRITFILTAGLV